MRYSPEDNIIDVSIILILLCVDIEKSNLGFEEKIVLSGKLMNNLISSPNELSNGTCNCITYSKSQNKIRTTVPFSILCHLKPYTSSTLRTI